MLTTTTKLCIALALLTGCSGSSAGVDAFSAPQAQADAAQTPADPVDPPSAKKPANVAPTGQDAGADAETPDSSAPDSSAADAGVDSGNDSGQVVIIDPPPPPAPRYGVSLDGSANQRVYANLPGDTAGQAQATFEGYFSLRQRSSEGSLFSAASAGWCAVVTTGVDLGKAACCTSDLHCAYSKAVLPLNAFFHLAWVFDAGVSAMYLDGVLQGTASSAYLTLPAYQTFAGADPRGKLVFGSTDVTASPYITVDEFRVSFSKLYANDFAPSAHLDAPGKLNFLLDEGAGPTSGTATLYGGASWVAVNR